MAARCAVGAGSASGALAAPPISACGVAVADSQRSAAKGPGACQKRRSKKSIDRDNELVAAALHRYELAKSDYAITVAARDLAECNFQREMRLRHERIRRLRATIEKLTEEEIDPG